MARRLPVRPIVLPAALKGQKNGDLNPKLLRTIRPSGRLYIAAASAYDSMKRAAKLDGIMLKPTATFDSYRPLSIQTAVFLQRYTKEPVSSSTRRWNGETWYLKPGNAPVAAPGTSNHGWGLAVDIWNVSQNGRLDWLLENQERFGFSHELQSEPWHIRYTLGDKLTPTLSI